MQQDIWSHLAADLGMRQDRLFRLRILWLLHWHRGNWGALILIRMAQAAHAKGNHRAAGRAARRLRLDFGCFVQPAAVIGPGLRLPHPNGIVIGSGARIGARCTLYHQVTLGAARQGEGFSTAYPRLGDDVMVFAGAKLIGAIRIGDRATVGANAVVLKDIPDGHRAIGVPAHAERLRT
ncbi:serine acetyltransferase [Sphingomonas solaris]|uniref:Serine acetyltransferase n=1 Tax=Alterirhizorhabdus solaris TaxID=2529389 RepID=A0A558R2P2_9SPHN|nr:serine acetyltransferase [Sphingomonas solaris]